MGWSQTDQDNADENQRWAARGYAAGYRAGQERMQARWMKRVNSARQMHHEFSIEDPPAAKAADGGDLLDAATPEQLARKFDSYFRPPRPGEECVELDDAAAFDGPPAKAQPESVCPHCGKPKMNCDCAPTPQEKRDG